MEEMRTMTKILSRQLVSGSIFEPGISRIKVQKLSALSNLAGQKFGEAKYIRAINHVFPDTDTMHGSKLSRLSGKLGNAYHIAPLFLSLTVHVIPGMFNTFIP